MSSSLIPLVIATTNKKKLAELQTLLAGLPFTLRIMSEFPDIIEVEENGKTFEENALLKAKGYARQTGILTLGEDSGLCCDALDGAPGVYSARFSGEEKNDAANNEKLLRLLEKVPDNCRGAHYTCAIAVCEGEETIGTVTGEVYGAIAREESGENGFGYDPLFYYPPFKKTFGESDPDRKNEVSHRAQALKSLRSLLEGYARQKGVVA